MRVILHFDLWLTCFFQFSQGINNPEQLKFASYNTFLFSSSSARTWRRRCFSLWKRRCRAPQAPTAGEPVTCLPRSWSGASCLSNGTARRDDGRRIPQTTARLRSPRNRLLLMSNLWSRWGLWFLVFGFFKDSLWPRWETHWNHFGPAEILESRASHGSDNQVVRCRSE